MSKKNKSLKDKANINVNDNSKESGKTVSASDNIDTKKSEKKSDEKVEKPDSSSVAMTSDKKEESPEPPVKMSRAQKVLSKFDIFGDLFFLNVFFFVTSLPIITIGASFTAMYTVTNKMIRNEEGPIKDEYFKAFKSNFKQATAIWMVDLLFIIFVVFQYSYYLTNENQFSKMLFIFMGFEFILMAFAFPLQFPLLARYDNTTVRTMLNALVLSMTHLGVWFRMFFIWMFPVALYYLRPNYLFYTWYLWGMILCALFTYVCSMFLVRFYEKLENREVETGSEE